VQRADPTLPTEKFSSRFGPPAAAFHNGRVEFF
jgi:hypothetical protein